MTGELFRQREAKVIRYHSSVPEHIRAQYQQMFSEMPRDLYAAVITQYGSRGGEIAVAEKIRMLNPSYKPFFVGYTRPDPPTSHVQFTGRNDNMEVRPYNDLKRNLYHEIGHNVFSDYNPRNRNFRAEFAATYAREIQKLQALAVMNDPGQTDPSKIKPVADYFMPGGTFDRAGAAKEAFCEILSFASNGGIHSFNRPDGTPIDIERDFPETTKLVREAMAAYIAKHDPAEAQRIADINELLRTNPAEGMRQLYPDKDCKELPNGMFNCKPKTLPDPAAP
ncbi:MAG: hypothetical protein SFW65_00375 [Alphaproteobacteria bacterium]|nr:hypothetical protein [Alphaproteobacteria bacterium]